MELSAKHQELIELYRKMAEHTKPECARCFRPYSCCDALYCDMTIRFAKSKWGVDLQPTGHKKLPLMGVSGCTAEPHLRPMCSMHVCVVNSIGSKPGDRPWTEEYYRLHQAIQLLEMELFPP
jgi:hypothetical protein